MCSNRMRSFWREGWLGWSTLTMRRFLLTDGVAAALDSLMGRTTAPLDRSGS
jgi:hypothetical protein